MESVVMSRCEILDLYVVIMDHLGSRSFYNKVKYFRKFYLNPTVTDRFLSMSIYVEKFFVHVVVGEE